MHPVIENILERPTSHKIIIWAVSVAFIGFIFWQYMLSSTIIERAELEEKVANLEKSIVDERRRAQNLTKLRAMVKDLDIKLKVALQELPDRREIPDLLESISNLARDAGLEVSLFKPDPENMKEFYAEVPVAITVDGTFHQVATFFDEVGRLSRIVNINQITMREPEVNDAQVDVKVDLLATTFRYLDEAERAKVTAALEEKENSGSKKRKK